MTLAPVALASSAGGCFELLGVAAVDHHLAAGFRQGARAGFAEPAARCADDGLAAGNSEIHGDVLCLAVTIGASVGARPRSVKGLSLNCCKRLLRPAQTTAVFDSGGLTCSAIPTRR